MQKDILKSRINSEQNVLNSSILSSDALNLLEILEKH